MTDDEIGFLDQFVKLRYRAHRRFIGPLSNSTIQIKKLIGILVE
jgi:hypothetical protein